MKPKSTLVLLANEAHARLLENHGIGKGLDLLLSLDRTEAAEERAHYADRAGRAAAGTAHHGWHSSTDERTQMRTAFAKEVAEAFEQKWQRGNYDRAALAAAPAMLGALRDVIPAGLRDAVEVEMNKDLLHLTPKQVVEHFDDKIAF